MHWVAYRVGSVHISARLEQHPDRLNMPIVAGANVEGGTPILQHIPSETSHGLHRRATLSHGNAACSRSTSST